MEEELLIKITSTIEQITHKKVDKFDMNANIRDQLALDSMQMVQFFSLLEMEMDKELPLSLMNAQTANEFVCLLKRE